MRSPGNLGVQWFEQVWNGGDATVMDRFGRADNFKAHGADGVTRSLDDFKQFHALMTQAMPDLRLEVTHSIEANSMIATYWVATGTHTGNTDALGRATNRKITVEGLSLIRLENGVIVEGWDDYDSAGLLAQLGVGV
jgi:predicted ester cyclase